LVCLQLKPQDGRQTPVPVFARDEVGEKMTPCEGCAYVNEDQHCDGSQGPGYFQEKGTGCRRTDLYSRGQPGYKDGHGVH
jgi:hypothetical protein